jgi:nucleotide-binding universal stress UspA family protein
MQLRAILVPTDFSPHADLALEAARELARRSGARLELLHAFHLPPEAVPHLTDAALQRMRAEAGAELESRCARARESGLAADARWVEAPPAHAIPEAAAKIAADLIALGSHGRTGMRYALLGSVAARVARVAPCPVLTLKQRPKAVWPPRRIAVAMDFSDASRRALVCARDLARLHGPCHLVLVHARYVPPDLAAVIAEHGPALLAADERAARELETLLCELQDAGLSAEYVCENGHPAEVLQRVAARVGADLIALGTHARQGLSRLLLGSVAEHVLRSASCAVLTVGPAGARDATRASE